MTGVAFTDNYRPVSITPMLQGFPAFPAPRIERHAYSTSGSVRISNGTLAPAGLTTPPCLLQHGPDPTRTARPRYLHQRGPVNRGGSFRRHIASPNRAPPPHSFGGTNHQTSFLQRYQGITDAAFPTISAA